MMHGPRLRIDPLGPALCCGIAAHGQGGRRPCAQGAESVSRDEPGYLDEQTSGYTIAHNAMVNAPTNVAQNNTGTNTVTDNPASNSSSVISTAGIEASYADIKTTTIPVPSF